MPLVVVDISARLPRLDEVLENWVRGGLVPSLGYARLADSDFTWFALESSDGTDAPTSRNEILNRLGAAASLQIVVVADTRPDAEWKVVNEIWVRTLDELRAQFPNDLPEPSLVVVAKQRAVGVSAHEGFSDVLSRELLEGRWHQVFAVSPEDSPTPQHGDELNGRPLEVVVAHAVVALFNGWATPSETSQRPPGAGRQTFRLARTWSRVVDLGFVADHVASRLALPSPDSDIPTAIQVDGKWNDFRRLNAVVKDFQVGVVDEEKSLEGLAFLVAILTYVIRGFPKQFVRELIETVLRPLWRFLNRVVRWLSERLGAKPRTLKPLPPDVADPVEAAKVRIRADLKMLATGIEMPIRPAAAPVVWREVSEFVILAVDKGELTRDQAVGRGESGTDSPSLFSRLAEEYRLAEVEARSLLEEGLRVGEESEAILPDWKSLTTGRRLWRVLRFVVLAVVLAGLLLAGLALVLPALALVILMPIALPLLGVMGIVRRSLRALVRAFHRKHSGVVLGSDQIGELQRRFMTTAKFAYRQSQLNSWRRVVSSLFDQGLKGPPLDPSGYLPFHPGLAPRSLRIASGLVEVATLDSLANQVRQNKDHPYFSTVWKALREAHPKAFDDDRRFAREGELAKLLRIESDGLDPAVLDVGRGLVNQLVDSLAVSQICSRVVPWVRQIDRYGVESVGPAEGIVPLGPVGRVELKVETAAVDPIAQYMNCVADVVSEDRVRVGLGAKVGLNGKWWITAGALAASGSSFNGQPGSLVKMDGSLAGISVVSDSGAVIAPPRSLTVGLQVIFGAMAESTPQPTQGLITSIDVTGVFQIDGNAILGSPVIDVLAGTLLGVVIGVNPTTVAGPLIIEAALRQGALQTTAHTELDPGIRIPIDVLRQPGRGGVDLPLPQPELDTSSAVLIDDFMSVSGMNNGAFTATIVNHFNGSSVADSFPSSPIRLRRRVLTPSGLVDEGRVLMLSGLVELSNSMPYEALGCVSVDVPIARPNEQKGPEA